MNSIYLFNKTYKKIRHSRFFNQKHCLFFHKFNFYRMFLSHTHTHTLFFFLTTKVTNICTLKTLTISVIIILVFIFLDVDILVDITTTISLFFQKHCGNDNKSKFLFWYLSYRPNSAYSWQPFHNHTCGASLVYNK